MDCPGLIIDSTNQWTLFSALNNNRKQLKSEKLKPTHLQYVLAACWWDRYISSACKNTHLKSTPFYCHTATESKAAASVSDTTTVNSSDATYQKIFLAGKGPDQLLQMSGFRNTNVQDVTYSTVPMLSARAPAYLKGYLWLYPLMITYDSEKSVAMLARSTGFTDTRVTRSLT